MPVSFPNRCSSARGSRVLLALLVAVLVIASSTGTGEAKIVRSVTMHKALIGHRVSVSATGLQPGMHVSPFILAARSGSCCGVGIRQTKIVSAAGRVHFTFRWPTHYYRCVRDHGRRCVRASWRSGTRPRIGVAAPEMYKILDGGHGTLRGIQATRAKRAASPAVTRAAAGPTDPTAGRRISYSTCRNSSWMTRAGTSGSGVGADVSFAPTEKTRLLGRFFGESVWVDLQGWSPLPYLTNDEYQSIYQQFVCHLEGGVRAGDTGPTYDFEAWRPIVGAHTSLTQYSCNPDSGATGGDQYLNQIVQWAADPNPQTTAWLIDRSANGQLERRWIPSSQIYHCLKGSGTTGPTALDYDFFSQYLKPRGSDLTTAACETSGGGGIATPPVISPNPNAQVTLAQGPAAPSGYRYAITLAGFAANASVSITCFDSASPDGFFTFSLTTNASGQATTVSYCYSGAGPDHWVAAGGVSSNHVSWGGGSGSAPQVWSEQESPNHPVNTFANYHNASVQGQAIAAGQWVEVSCKVYDPTIGTVNPDGYWYRIASAPWNNTYYAPANTFMNGDPPGGPYAHNTDMAVQNC
jgi:hypothetical protein